MPEIKLKELLTKLERGEIDQFDFEVGSFTCGFDILPKGSPLRKHFDFTIVVIEDSEVIDYDYGKFSTFNCADYIKEAK